MQKDNVERAKMAVLTYQTGEAAAATDGCKQSDHLVMMVAYRKWEKILSEVSIFNNGLMPHVLISYRHTHT